MGLFTGKRPSDLGVRDGRLKAAPSSPNCVSSQALSAYHKIEPLAFKGNGKMAFDRLKSLVAELPRSEIIETSEKYLYAECKTKLLGFVDDVEFYLDEDAVSIHVRSASRLGRKDFGVNRARIETIRLNFKAD